MKTTISHLFITLFAISLLFTACKKEEKDCGTLSVDVSTTLSAYTADPSENNCDNYRAALEAYVSAGCQDSAGFQNTADALTCR